MECPRCGGLMVIERYQDYLESAGETHFMGNRCVICGEILDSTIQKNREEKNGAVYHADRPDHAEEHYPSEFLGISRHQMN